MRFEIDSNAHGAQLIKHYTFSNHCTANCAKFSRDCAREINLFLFYLPYSNGLIYMPRAELTNMEKKT